MYFRIAAELSAVGIRALGKTRMSFLLELGMVCFFRAQSKAIQQLRHDWVAVVLPLLGEWDSLSAGLQAHGAKGKRRELSLCSVALLTALWYSHFPLQTWSWKHHVCKRCVCWALQLCLQRWDLSAFQHGTGDLVTLSHASGEQRGCSA